MLTAAQIIEALGDTTAVAREIGAPPTTVQSWKGANFIPGWRRPALLALAAKLERPLSTDSFPAKPRKPTSQPTDQAVAQ